MRVFLGITGASGAPYAARLLEALHGAGAEVGVAASNAGIEVIATELYGDPSLPRDEVMTRFAGDRATVVAPNDYSSPYASGSPKIGACVICPLLDVDRRDDRDGRDGEPDPQGGLGGPE